jgi:hypothetical protein
MNMNKLAKIVSETEGKKKSVDIAQIKEIINITFQELSQYPDKEIIETIRTKVR